MRLLAALAALAFAAGASAQPAPPSPEARAAWGFDRSDLPPDPRIRFGVLANGLRYAILPNRTPRRAVSLRLVVRVGAIAGAPGEAHYLEHMAFMGSHRIPEGAAARLRRREHLRLIDEFNAHTGHSDTYYRIDLPRPGRDQIRRILFILREMASELTLAPEAVARTRQAVLDEVAENARPEPRREADQVAFFLAGTRLARASLAGSEAEVRAITAEGLREFYRLHYSPDRTTLIVVGDVEPGWIEGQVRGQFAGWPAREPAADPPPDSVDPARSTAFRLLVTPSGSTWVTVAAVAPRDRGDAVAPRDSGFLQSLGADMLAARVLGHRGGDRPFMDAEAAVEDYYRSARIARFSVRAIDGDWRLALGVAEQELRCALANGFTQDELAITLEREAERLAAYVAPETSRILADRLTEMAGMGVVPTAPGPASDTAAYLGRIRLDAVNAAFREAWASPGRLIHVTHDRPIEGGETRLAEAWAAGAPCPASAR